MIRAVIVDFGGVLVRTEDASGRRAWEQRLGLDPNTLDELVFLSEASQLASVGQLRETEMWRELARTFGISETEVETLREDFFAGDVLDTALLAYLRGLRPQLRTAILSNAWDGARALFTGRYGLGDSFDAIFISAELGMMKPAVEVYHRVCAELGVQPAEAIFLDDFPANIAGAQAAGLNVVRFRSTQQAVAEIQSLLAQNNPS